MNEFWKKNKKNIIACIVVVLLCGVSFVCGRTIRLRGSESSGTRIEQSINGAEQSTNKIGNGLDSLGNVLGTINDNNGVAIVNLNGATLRNAELESLIDECKRAYIDGQKSFEDSSRRIESAVGTTDYILAVAAVKAEQNERTLARIAELLGLSDESSGKQ